MKIELEQIPKRPHSSSIHRNMEQPSLPPPDAVPVRNKRREMLRRTNSMPLRQAPPNIRAAVMKAIKDRKGASEREKRHEPMDTPTISESVSTREQNYEVIMERFQLRKISRPISREPGRGSARVSPSQEKHLHEIAKALLHQHPPSKSILFRPRWRMMWDRIIEPFHPDSAVGEVRKMIQLIMFVLQIIYIPIQAAFFPVIGPFSAAFYICCEICYLMSFIITLNTAYYDKTELVTSRRRILHRYLHGSLLIDLLAAVPVNIICYSNYSSVSDIIATHSLFQGFSRISKLDTYLRAIQVFWLARAARIGSDFWKWFSYSRYSHLLRIAKLVFLVLLTAHYLACCWEVISFDSPRNAQIPLTVREAADLYARNFYYSIQLIQGQGVDATSTTQQVFSSVAIMAGSLVIAIVFGNVAMLVSNFNANSTNYQRKLEGVFATMSKLQLPNDLRDRIHLYYDHLWQEYESLDGDIVKFSKELTHTLALEVGLFRYMNLVMHLHFWKDCSADFVTQIILHLVVRVYLPDDYVMRRGEVDDQLFMINRGTCERTEDALQAWEDMSPTDTPVMRSLNSRRSVKESVRTSELSDLSDANPVTLHPGQAFGELALIMNYKRTKNVRAVSHVEMCVLFRSDFQFLLSRYSEDRKTVLTSVLQSCVKSKEGLPSPLDKLVTKISADVEKKIPPSDLSPIEIHRRQEQVDEMVLQQLIEKIASDGSDETIRFGVQGHSTEKPVESAMNSCCCSGKPRSPGRTTSQPQENIPSLRIEEYDNADTSSEQLYPKVNAAKALVSKTNGRRVKVRHDGDILAAITRSAEGTVAELGNINARLAKVEQDQAKSDSSFESLQQSMDGLRMDLRMIKDLLLSSRKGIAIRIPSTMAEKDSQEQESTRPVSIANLQRSSSVRDRLDLPLGSAAEKPSTFLPRAFVRANSSSHSVGFPHASPLDGSTSMGQMSGSRHNSLADQLYLQKAMKSVKQVLSRE